jgi:hypothetical protein
MLAIVHKFCGIDINGAISKEKGLFGGVPASLRQLECAWTKAVKQSAHWWLAFNALRPHSCTGRLQLARASSYAFYIALMAHSRVG